MTPNIKQQVVPRSRNTFRGASISRQQSFFSYSNRRFLQMGNSNHATVTITFGVLALLLVGSLGFFYLQQVVGTASEGSDIRAIEAKLGDMKERQKELELEGAQLRSLQAVGEHVNDLNLVTTDKVSYLASTTERVAVAAN